jgi:hypothetical protein
MAAADNKMALRTDTYTAALYITSISMYFITLFNWKTPILSCFEASKILILKKLHHEKLLKTVCEVFKKKMITCYHDNMITLS